MSAGVGAMAGLLILGPARNPRGALLPPPQFHQRGLSDEQIDSLREATRGGGLRCQCGKYARITARGRTLCYECFDEDMGYVLDPGGHAKQRMRIRIREIDRMRDVSSRMIDEV